MQDIKSVGFTLNALKCAFFQKSIPYLGHIISENRIRVDPKRVEAITMLQPPTDTRYLRSFIGMVQLCHRFVENLNIIVALLYELLKANKTFKWISDSQTAFLKLLNILCSPPVLYSSAARDEFIFDVWK